MSTFIIRNKETLEQWVASSGKNSWKKANHAKAAFANSSGKTKRDPLLEEEVKSLGKYDSLKFNDQDVYEVIEVYSSQEKHSAAIERKFNKIKDKLEENKGLFTNVGWEVGGEYVRCLNLLKKLKGIVDEGI